MFCLKLPQADPALEEEGEVVNTESWVFLASFQKMSLSLFGVFFFFPY